jgi:hypothetical protein
MANELARRRAQEPLTVINRLSLPLEVVGESNSSLMKPSNTGKTSAFILKAFQFEIVLNCLAPARL